MRLGVISKAASRQTGPASVEQTATGRALVAVAPPIAVPGPPATCHQAAFLAQLLAMKDQHPQTRERRRAEPHEAIAVYRATAALTGR